MNKPLFSALAAGLAFVALACGGGGDNDGAPTPTTASGGATTAATSTPVPAANATPTPAAVTLADLSLVYADRSKGQGAEIYTANFEGASPKKVVTLTNPSVPLDVRGKVLAATQGNQISFIDLTTGTSKNLSLGAGSVTRGAFLDNQTFLYLLVSGGCGPGGGPKSALMRVDVTAMTQKELLSLPNNVTIAGVDAASGSVALVPRGCDPGVQTINIYNASDGKEILKVAAPGCGEATANLVKKLAVVSWVACTVDAGKPLATLYDYSGQSVTKKDIAGPGGGLDLRSIILRPGSSEAVFGARAIIGQSPGSTRGNGIWLINVSSLEVTRLFNAEGAEQTPLLWTRDGRYLLAQTVLAQGMCSYSYADATSKAVKPIATEITFCGVNGEVIGWTSLK